MYKDTIKQKQWTIAVLLQTGYKKVVKGKWTVQRYFYLIAAALAIDLQDLLAIAAHFSATFSHL